MRQLSLVALAVLAMAGCSVTEMPSQVTAEVLAQGQPSPGNFPGGASASCYSTTSSGGNVDYTVPSNDYFCFDTAAVCGGSAAGHVCMRWNSATSELEFASGLVIDALGTGGGWNASAASGNTAYNVKNSGAKICLANGTDCMRDVAGAATFSGAVASSAGTLLASTEWSLSLSDPITAVGATNDFWVFGPTQNATTMRNCSCAVPIAGTGTGTETWKITGAANGGGTVYATVVIPCTATQGATCTSCTINTSAIPAGTTLHAAVTTACTTADVTSNVNVDMTTP